MKATESLIEARDVSKSFGALQVLDRVSLACGEGETILLLGANGAGKSTLLRVLAGLGLSDSGSVARVPTASVGFISHQLSLYSKLSVRENLRLFGSLAGVSPQAVDGAMLQWGVSDAADVPVCDLSKGNQARVGLARAFLNRPRIRLLDEPSSNLDERGVALLRTALEGRDCTASATIVATHDLHRLHGIATRIVVMERGKIVSDSGPRAPQAEIERLTTMYRESNR